MRSSKRQPMYKRILVALDASERDDVVLEHIGDLARTSGAAVVLLRVACYDARERDQMQREVSRAERALRHARERLAERFGVEAEEALVHGEPTEVIVAECLSRGCDLVAMATHGHGALYDFLLGSVANQVRHRLDVPVLTVRVPLGKHKQPGGAEES